MKVLVVGSGGREHALVWKISQSKMVDKVYCSNHNAGISEIATCLNFDSTDIEGLSNFIKNENIDLTVIGPEVPLALGLSDKIRENGGLVFGPSQEAAMLESSKIFCKQFLSENKIPIAPYKVFSDPESAKEFIDKDHELIKDEKHIVVKADGLAAGKGVKICLGRGEAKKAVDEIMVQKKYGDAGNKVVIEEFISGEEISFMVLTDGENILPLETARDYKKAFDKDKGPNTGGMGSYSPSTLVNDDLKEIILSDIIKPTILAMNNAGKRYQGVLYAGLIHDGEKLYVLEYNVRFGDPETQPVLFRMESDLVPILKEIAEGELKTKEIKWSDYATTCVVLCSGGYPTSYEKEKVIHGLTNIKSTHDICIFHAGTKTSKDKIVTNGGRVLGVVARGKDLAHARKLAYKGASHINFEKMHYRKDIGAA